MFKKLEHARTGVFFIILAVTSGALHFFWENSHVALYTGYEHITRFPITVYATTGDVAYTIVGVALYTLYKGVAWIKTPKGADVIAFVVMGLAIALFVEYKALAMGKWQYLDAMPIIPILNVGLSPIVQMTILLPLTVLIASRSVRAI